MIIFALPISIIGAISTYVLSQKRPFGAIRASTLLSILSYLIFWGIGVEAELYSVVFFGGSFVGMSASHRFGYFSVTLGSIFFAFFYIFLIPLLKGYGGALGLSAFLSVALTHLIRLIRHKLSSTV